MGYTVTENGNAYDRGVAAGEIAARLKDHDTHLNKINGSMDRVAEELKGVKLALQRLSDAAEADRSTVKTTAAALKEADQARRDKSTQRWSPTARVLAILAVAVPVAALIAYILISGSHHP